MGSVVVDGRWVVWPVKRPVELSVTVQFCDCYYQIVDMAPVLLDLGLGFSLEGYGPGLGGRGLGLGLEALALTAS